MNPGAASPPAAESCHTSQSVPTTLSGNLDTFSLADLLQWLEMNGLSGRVTITRGDIRRTIDLKTGAIVFVSSSRPEERLGSFLVARGVLPATDVYELLAENFLTGRNLTQLILDHELLSREGLVEAVEALAVGILLDLFHWTGATFEFDPSYATEDILRIHLSLRGQVLAIHGVKSVDDSARLPAFGPCAEPAESIWRRDFEPEALALTFWSLLEEMPVEDGASGGLKERYVVFTHFADKVREALRRPFQPLPLFSDAAEMAAAALAGEEALEQIARIAALDPFLTLDVLHLANALRTPHQGLLGTVSSAASTMGPRALRRLVELLVRPGAPRLPARNRLEKLVRRAALSTAVAASHAATAQGGVAEEAYTLGLLEPLGGYEILKLLISEDFEPGPFRGSVLRRFRPPYGATLARKLNLPSAFADVLGSSGRISKASSSSEQLIFLAKQLAPSEQIGREWTSDDPELANRFANLQSDPELPARIARDTARLREILGT